MSTRESRLREIAAKEHRISKRIAEEQRERQDALARRAGLAGIRLEPDYCHAGQYIAWEPGKPGECELVSHERCTCHQFRVWHRCPHFALMIEWEAAQREEIAA